MWGLPFLITELLTDVRVGVRARLDGDRRALAGGWLGARATEAGGDERRRRRRGGDGAGRQQVGRDAVAEHRADASANHLERTCTYANTPPSNCSLSLSIPSVVIYTYK